MGGAQKFCGPAIRHPRKSRHQKKAARNSRLPPGESLISSCFLGYQGTGCFARPRVDDAHLVPVIGQFLSTVEAHHVGSDPRGRRVTTRPRSNSHWKTVARVPAAKHYVHQSGEHSYPPYHQPLPTRDYSRRGTYYVQYLRFPKGAKGSLETKRRQGRALTWAGIKSLETAGNRRESSVLRT
jgi:hypothetical protein